jgi:hypothetical protein
MSESSSLLSNYEKILHDGIEDLRGRIHEAHNPIYNESLMIEIETLQWVLFQEDMSKR